MQVMTDGMTDLSKRKWLSMSQLQDYTSLSKETIYRRIYAKQIPFHRIGKLYIFDRVEIDEWIKKKKS